MKRNQWSKEVKRYGDSLGVIMPPDLIKDLGIKEGERYLFTVENLEENGKEEE